ncbi:hypothetical protein O181_088756 [Austropuccinia psidii MF-1]|uniref:Cns1/TTC4 wheel domain-containing protein n=1 Tax=Austropuccinia psidii MF-1 TaxID=1389203 RepID=A0A9Q3IS57_9BASI|nr:hypothetical protein [Austropuccinia psidii MF-1]
MDNGLPLIDCDGGQQTHSSIKMSLHSPPERPTDNLSTQELWQEAGWDKVPLFMKGSSDASNPSNPLTSNPSIQALQALIYDDQPSHQIQSIQALKTRADQLFKSKSYHLALGFYNQAIDFFKSSSSNSSFPSEILLSLFANRAACHLALENFRSCLSDCHLILKDPLKVPTTTLVRKSLFRSAKASIGLNKLNQALDLINKLINLDSRDQVNDQEPQNLKNQILHKIQKNLHSTYLTQKNLKYQNDLNQALRLTLKLRGISISADNPFPPHSSNLPPGLKPAHFDHIPSEIDINNLSNSSQLSIIYPVYVLRPKDQPPTRDLILSWHEDHLISDHLQELCAQKDSHHFYIISLNRKIFKCGNHLSIRKISALISKSNSNDTIPLGSHGNLEFYLLPIGKLEQDWIAETKIALES